MTIDMTHWSIWLASMNGICKGTLKLTAHANSKIRRHQYEAANAQVCMNQLIQKYLLRTGSQSSARSFLKFFWLDVNRKRIQMRLTAANGIPTAGAIAA
jgi:hypothetical protein